jgi:hypothetical protein
MGQSGLFPRNYPLGIVEVLRIDISPFEPMNREAEHLPSLLPFWRRGPGSRRKMSSRDVSFVSCPHSSSPRSFEIGPESPGRWRKNLPTAKARYGPSERARASQIGISRHLDPGPGLRFDPLALGAPASLPANGFRRKMPGREAGASQHLEEAVLSSPLTKWMKNSSSSRSETHFGRLRSSSDCDLNRWKAVTQKRRPAIVGLACFLRHVS